MSLLLLGHWTLVTIVVVETFCGHLWSRSGAPNPVVGCSPDCCWKSFGSPQSHCGLCPGLLLKGSGFRLKGIPIVEGEPNLCGAVHRRRGWNLCGCWTVVSVHTSPTRRTPFQGGTREYILVSACFGYFYTRAFYLCTLHCDSLRAWSILYCYHLVACLA